MQATLAVLLCVACDSPGALSEPVDDFTITSRAVVEGRVLTESGTPLAGASLIALAPPLNPSALHTAPTAITDANGRFFLSIGRIGNRPSLAGPDTLTATIVTRLSQGAVLAQEDTVVLRFAPSAQSPTPTVVDVKWRAK